jgi:hypothetical protein
MRVLKQLLQPRFALQLFDLRMQSLVFFYFVFEELHSHARLFFNATRCEQIGIGQLVVAVTKVVDLETALFDQRIEAEIDFTKTEPRRFAKSLWESGFSSRVWSRP